MRLVSIDLDSLVTVSLQRAGDVSSNRKVGEQSGDPKVTSGVYVIDPHSKIIMHMYDDRGLDIIAAELNTIRPLFESFRDWILDNQRHRIELRFSTASQEPAV